MRPAVKRRSRSAPPDEPGVYSFERAEPAKLSAAALRALQANPKAAAFFTAQPPWYQRTADALDHQRQARGHPRRRLAALITDSAAGRTVKPLTRPAKKP